MSTDNRTKINIITNNWVRGTVNTVDVFNQYGVTYDLLKRYRQSKWIESVGSGAYKLYNDSVEWPGALLAIQEQLNLSIHPGGKTSLELLGYSHYLSDEIRQLYLFGYRGEKLPIWFKKYKWQVNTRYTANQLFTENTVVGLTKYKYRDFEITISAPERAILEMVNHFPENHGFNECYSIMENLVALRPQLCQDLLERCNSIKTKRTFLFMVEHIRHSWLEELDTRKIDLGTGNRSLVKNGILNKKYKITVPKEYA